MGLQKRCAKDHRHTPLVRGSRTKSAQVYPEGVRRAIVAGLVKQIKVDGRLASGRSGMAMAVDEAGWDEASWDEAGYAATPSSTGWGEATLEAGRDDDWSGKPCSTGWAVTGQPHPSAQLNWPA